MQIDLSIIIVNYNVKEFLLNLLESISHASKNISIEIIVIDNNSHDGSLEAVKNRYPSVITIANQTNVGFGRANNQGLEISKGKYILLINPDTIVREDTLSKMISFMDNNQDVGLSGCRVLNPDGTLQLACRRSFPGPWVSFTKVTGLSSLFPNSKIFAKYNLTYLSENESYEVDAVSGSFMMLNREAYDKTKGFDTDFFMYGEDLDLCYRIQKSGMKVYFNSETEIIHYKGESTKRSQIDETKIFYDAMHQFVRKHFSSSIFIEAILQFGIMLRKILAFANLNKYIIIGIILDFFSFYFLIHLAESIYATERWPGFPEIFKPWVYIVPSLFQIIVSGIIGSYKRNSLSVFRSVISLSVGLVILTSLTFFLKQYAFSRAVVLITYGFSVVAFSIWRIILKFSFLKSGLTEDSFSNTVIVGVDPKAVELNKKLTENLSSPYKVIGFIGNEISEIGNQIEGKTIIGSLGNLRKVAREFKVNNVIFSSESIEFDTIFSTIAECQGENINFLISGNELDYMVGKSNIAHIEDVPLLKVDYNISRPTHKFIKRLFDFFISLVLLILIYPPLILLSKIISFDKELIIFVKSIPHILIGKLSFVGPREDDDNSELYLGKKGITGLWFIDTIKNTDVNENRRLDLFYAKNQNIWLDLEIIGKTIAKYLISRRNNG
jgi:GT2 family glycosyltransferase/lipopolysaccharide/colanic/teichoic acid biosynthesis glycosyltransferase